jgi:lipopolysaccharide biosynthesis glycosyltransferase
MKIGVATLQMGEEYIQNTYYCRKSLVEYCEKHGYDLCEANDLFDESRPAMWSKILILEKFISKYDYIIWVDADIIIMNPSWTLEYFISGFMKDKDMMLDIDSGNQINTGMWFIKNTLFSKRILSLIYNLEAIAGNYHEQGVLNELYYRNTLCLKQKCMIIKESEQRLFNSTMYIHHMGDFNIHFMGIRTKYLSQVSRDHYMKTRDDENEQGFENRMEWYKNRYNTPNTRYTLPEPTLNIGVCTLAFGDKYDTDAIKYGRRSMVDYCQKHGYDFITESKNLDNKRAAHWSKLLLLLRLMESENNYDYVVWLDADIMIMNENMKITDLIYNQMKGKDFLLSKDISNHINTGVWIVKNSQYARDIIKLNYELPELCYRGYEDQDVFNALYYMNAMDLKNNSVILEQDQQHLMNCCVGCFQPNKTFLIHFFSLSKQGLTSAFNDFYPKQKDDENHTSFEARKLWIDKH